LLLALEVAAFLPPKADGSHSFGVDSKPLADLAVLRLLKVSSEHVASFEVLFAPSQGHDPFLDLLANALPPLFGRSHRLFAQLPDWFLSLSPLELVRDVDQRLLVVQLSPLGLPYQLVADVHQHRVFVDIALEDLVHLEVQVVQLLPLPLLARAWRLVVFVRNLQQFFHVAPVKDLVWVEFVVLHQL